MLATLPQPPTRTLKAYGRHIPCPRRDHPGPSGPDPGPSGRQLEVVVEVLLADGAGRHAGDIAANARIQVARHIHRVLTERKQHYPPVRMCVLCKREKKRVLTKNTWTSEQRVGCDVRYLREGSVPFRAGVRGA